MRMLLAGAATLVLVSAQAAAAPPPPVMFGDTPSASASAAPASPAAHTALTLKLSYPMTCGQPGRGPVTVMLPPAMRVPVSIPRLDVLVRGKAAPSVAVTGKSVVVGLPRPPQIICQSIVQGTLTVVFALHAGLRNPAGAGSYPVVAHIGPRTFRARLDIR